TRRLFTAEGSVARTTGGWFELRLFCSLAQTLGEPAAKDSALNSKNVRREIAPILRGSTTQQRFVPTRDPNPSDELLLRAPNLDRRIGASVPFDCRSRPASDPARLLIKN